MVLFAPAIIDELRKARWHLALRVGALAAAYHVKPHAEGAFRHAFIQRITHHFFHIDHVVIRRLEREPIDFDDLQQLAVFGDDGFFVPMVLVGNERGSRDFALGHSGL